MYCTHILARFRIGLKHHYNIKDTQEEINFCLEVCPGVVVLFLKKGLYKEIEKSLKSWASVAQNWQLKFVSTCAFKHKNKWPIASQNTLFCQI